MSKTFAQLGLPNSIIRVLSRRGIVDPFPIQAASIADALDGRDVCGKAPTGSGKTLAFGLPILATVNKAKPGRPQALILAPTRELAEQIKVELAPLAKAVDRYVFSIYGGVGYGPQKNALRRGIDVLVATPGRLEDLIEQRAIDLGEVTMVVIDEADRMADMGFLPAVRRILDGTSRQRQTMLFSATLDGDVAVLSRDYQRDPVRHEAGTVASTTVDAEHHFWLVQHHDRIGHAADVVRTTYRSIVFTRTRHGADRLARQLSKLGVGAIALHGGRSQGQRSRAVKEFTSGRIQALVATDVAARGIHIDAVDAVVHFDPPADSKDYLHRSGRTARAGAAGIVVSLVTGHQRRGAQRMQKDLGLNAPIEAPRPLAEGGARIGKAPTQRPEPSAPRSTSRRRQGKQSVAGKQSGGSKQSGGNKQSVYVANLPWRATDRELQQLFGRYGTVHQATVVTDRRTGRSRGFGFVDMTDPQTAIEALHGTQLDGRDLTVRLARPKNTSGSPRAGNGSAGKQHRSPRKQRRHASPRKGSK